MLAFGEYRPDVNSLNRSNTQSVTNVLPQVDGYGPFKTWEEFTDALAATCRGAFMARKNDGSILIFAGTSTKLYLLDNTNYSWTDVSLGAGTYTALNDDRNWSFVQFGQKVIASHANDVMQVFDVQTDSAFSVLAGSPPQAGHIAVLNQFVVATEIFGQPYRVQWSGLNAITTWTSGVTFSGAQDLPDGGPTTGSVGGEFGIVVQSDAIRRMIFSPGSALVFQIDRIANDLGSTVPESIVESNGIVYMYSQRGFIAITQDGGITPIGFERVDRTFARSHDSGSPRLVQGRADSEHNVVLWTYASAGSSPDQFDRVLVFNHALDRWSELEMTGQYLAQIGKPGTTLEALDVLNSVVVSGAADNGSGLIRLTVSSTADMTTGDYRAVAEVTGTTEANGNWLITVIDATHIDLQGSTFSNAYVSGGYVGGSLEDLVASLDSYRTVALAEIAMFGMTGSVGFFTGPNLEATLDTAVQSSVAKRLFVRGMYPITDADVVYASTGRRENLNAVESFTSEALMNSQGFVPQRASTRHARGRVRIPTGTEWTFISGVEPDFVREGHR